MAAKISRVTNGAQHPILHPRDYYPIAFNLEREIFSGEPRLQGSDGLSQEGKRKSLQKTQRKKQLN